MSNSKLGGKNCGGKSPLKIILLESALELVPREVASHPQIVRSARRYGLSPAEMLLDKSIHYDAMRRLEERWKRGRPDIVHTTVLFIEDSPLFGKGMIELYIHVRDGRVFRVSGEARLPKNYERFKGLMAQLLKKGKVPPDAEKALVYEAYDTLEKFVEDHGGLVLLSEEGRGLSPLSAVALSIATCLPLGVGAFPAGDFRPKTKALAKYKVSLLGGKKLMTWGVVARLIYEYEKLNT
ncbi:MAG: 16S rRNA methyltransferase [Desulfurococcales archaeon]|nr:16S rRNA methyltransferase [Desulfurococcales archaeon]